jgi:hypothetical protein
MKKIIIGGIACLLFLCSSVSFGSGFHRECVGGDLAHCHTYPDDNIQTCEAATPCEVKDCSKSQKTVPFLPSY